MEILAQIVETELSGQVRTLLSPVALLGIMLLSSAVIFWTFLRVSFPRSFYIAAIVELPALATIGSLLADGSPFSRWPILIPLLIVILLQQVYEKAVDYRNRFLKELSLSGPARPTANVDTNPGETTVRPG